MGESHENTALIRFLTQKKWQELNTWGRITWYADGLTAENDICTLLGGQAGTGGFH